ncbi:MULTISPECIES: PepSY domain-containing protein [Oceanimonas]|uniref:PepSY domain-containing protein n=1 Tax=Oceanimonas smirnovii TaxID=264574 RepID=A0ABW7P0L1_9GAMM|nr:PepSY domain-containing protein [Oceanimonas sp. CAM02]MDV2858791.1 PepSY domain-containing protein [Oceanimonas sp. CAM02]
MKYLSLSATALALMLAAGSAHADDDCHDAVADWQPRENLRQMVEQHGWQVHRIKVDDGCYEVKGRDRHGNRIEAKYAPASLRIRSLEVEFSENSDLSAYDDLPTASRRH